MTRERQSAIPFAESERQAAELVAMRRMLLASRGTFSLSVAICNSPALRDYLIQQVQAAHPGIARVSLPSQTTSIFDFVRSATVDSNPAGVFVSDLERSLPSSAQRKLVLERLNGTRGLWKQAYACPIVFWLPEYAVRLLSTHARDLWAWRSHQFEFVSELAEPVAAISERFAGDLMAAANLDVDQKHFRLAELRQRIATAGDPPPQELLVHTLVWLTELGFLLATLGSLDEAEQTFRRLLDINEKFGRLEGMASAYGNLGLIHKTRGDLDRAEESHRKSLEINQKLGHLKGMASNYGNLGLIYQTRGDLDRAEKMHRKALDISEQLGRLEGMASQYGNLGLIYQTRGDLDRAEEMLRKSLEINEKLGRLEGMAIQYGNLGLIYKTRGDLDRAEEMLRKSLEIAEKLGHLEGMASQYGNLGLIYQKRGDLDRAEEMHRKSLDISEQLGRLEGVANQYGNLGTVREARGDLAGAREYWTKARDLYANIGMKPELEKVQGWLDELDAGRRSGS